MNPLLNTPEKIWLNCINISVQTNWADPAWIQKEYGAVVHPDVTFVLYRYGKDAGKREDCGSITLNNGVLEGSFPKQDKYYDVKNRLTYIRIPGGCCSPGRRCLGRGVSMSEDPGVGSKGKRTQPSPDRRCYTGSRICDDGSPLWRNFRFLHPKT